MSKSLATLLEGELEKAQSALAARDMVDQLQDIVEKLNKLKVEELDALKESIRSSIGPEVAEQFVNTSSAALDTAITAVTEAKATIDQAALSVSGEGDMPSPAAGMSDEGGDPAVSGEKPEDFEAPVTDVAAGGEEPLGRGKRESRERDLKRMVESLERKIRTQKRIVAEAKMKQLKKKKKKGVKESAEDGTSPGTELVRHSKTNKVIGEVFQDKNIWVSKHYATKLEYGHSDKRNAIGRVHDDHNEYLTHKARTFNRNTGTWKQGKVPPEMMTSYADDPIKRRVKESADATVKERNAFTAALANTPRGGKFTVGGKTYTDNSNVEETVDNGVGDMKVQQLLKRTGNNKIKLLKWLELNAEINNELDLNFDDVGLVYKGKTIVPMALHDAEVRMKDLLDAVLAAKKPKGRDNFEITEMARTSKKMKNKPSKKMK